MGDSDVEVIRWRRYGQDRLYVSRGDKLKVGWWDLKADEGHPESPADAQILHAAVAGWKAEAALGAAEPVRSCEEPVRELASPSPQGARETPAVPEHQAVIVPSRTSTPGASLATVPLAPEEQTMRPWLDLSTNAPGAEAREQALAARGAAPVKSLLARALGVHTDERAWRIGADGEERVAARLAKLAKKDPRWRSLHAIPVGNRGSDIDHVVMGPGGVFTLNTKHHPGAKIWVGGDTFMVDGHRQPYIRNSRHEASRAAKLLTSACGFPVHVEGVIVTVNADDIVVKTAPAGVHVVPRMQIARWLGRHGPIYSDSVVETIFNVARRSTTWQP
jgi:hypothetical protein